MRYSIINRQKGEERGFSVLTHQLLSKGEKMVVNENELATIGQDIASVATELGGELMTLAQVKNYIRKEKSNE